jgi:hypothetical protein
MRTTPGTGVTDAVQVAHCGDHGHASVFSTADRERTDATAVEQRVDSRRASDASGMLMAGAEGRRSEECVLL